MLKKSLLLVAIVSFLFFGYSYYQYQQVIKSDSYQFAQSQIEQLNHHLAERFGNEFSTHLSMFGYSFKNYGSYDSAVFKINIEGPIKNGILLLSMIKEGEEWKIEQFDIIHTSGFPFWLGWLS